MAMQAKGRQAEVVQVEEEEESFGPQLLAKLEVH
jgi:hypothetical protein